MLSSTMHYDSAGHMKENVFYFDGEVDFPSHTH